MKTLKQLGLFIAAATVMIACEEDLPQGQKESAVPIASFTATPDTSNINYILLDNTSQGEGVFIAWKFVDTANFVRGNAAGIDTAYYPTMGTYEITLLAGNDAGVDSTKMTVEIDRDDPTALPFDLLADYEDDQVGSWNAWGQDVTVVDNPAGNAVNGSSKVLRVGQSSAFETASRNETAIIDPTRATKLTVDAYFEVAGQLKLQIELDFGTGYFIDVPQGQWVTIEYVFDASGVGALGADTDYPIVMFQGNTDGNFYLDNIKYFE